MATILFDGVAYGMLLFVLACGLAVTLGLMNFVNLAHCAFGMIGGYVTVTLINRMGVPFLATLPLAFLVAAAASVVFERTMFHRLYRSSDLDQCLLTIGLVFVSVASAAWFYGTIQQPVKLPDWLRGSFSFMGRSFGVYRSFLIVVALALTAALVAMLGGQVDTVLADILTSRPHVQSGKLRMLGISAPRRLGGVLANVPTWREQGIEAVVSSWRGVIGARGLKPAQVVWWEQALDAAARSDEWKAELERNFQEPDARRGAEFRAFLGAEYERLKGVLTDLGLARSVAVTPR